MHSHEANALSAWIVLAGHAAEQAQREAGPLPARGLAALVLVDNHPACTIDWLHRRLGITHSGTVRLLDRLESLDLVTRIRGQGRREVALHLTADGRDRLRCGLAARSAALASMVAPLAPAEQAQLIALIGRAMAGGRRRREQADVACCLCDWQACRPDCPLDASVVDDPAV